jgi:hypothetical protein
MYFQNLELLCDLLHYVLRSALGSEAIFHVLVSSNRPLVIMDIIAFPVTIGKLHIKGELDTVSSGSP